MGIVLFSVSGLTAAASAAAAQILVARQRLLGIIDIPNQRSSHDVPKPRTGGIAILLSLLLGGALFLRFGGSLLPGSSRPLWLLGGALAFFGLGFLDDILHLPEKVRLGAQVLLSAVIALKGPRLQLLGLPGLHAMLPSPVAIVATAFWYTGFVNIFNFMDGIDGIAAGEAALVGILMAFASGAAAPLLVSASALGFLFLNRQPARIFLGDGGSYLLGFLLAAFTVAGTASTPFFVYVLFLGTFIADTSITLIRRIIRGEEWLKAHRSHYYQRLTALGFSHRAVSAMNLGATALLGASGLVYAHLAAAPQAAVLCAWCAACGLIAAKVHRLEALAPAKEGIRVGAPLLSVLFLMMLGARSSSAATASNWFPIGIYGVDDPVYMRELKRAGFDAIQTYGTDKKTLSTLASAAKKIRVKMVVDPDEMRQGPKEATAGWPIAAWYLKDEPEGQQMPPAQLAAIAKATREWDPKTPQTFVIGTGIAAREYGKIGDVLMLDWYPVPHLKLDSVADQIDVARRWMPSDKPLWFVVQAFDWAEYPQRYPKKPRIGRFPDFREIRFMSYLAIVHGAAGLFYYTLKKTNGQPLVAYPEQFQALTRVVREIKQLQPVLEGGTRLAVPFALSAKGIEAKAWRYENRRYAVLVNRTSQPLPAPAEIRNPRWRALFERRRDAAQLLKDYSGGYFIAPYQVLVFEED